MFDYHSQIHDYLEGRLTEAQRVAFELALEDDKELKTIVTNNDLYSQIADEIINQELESKIKTAINRRERNNSLKKIALLIVALLFLAILLYSINKSDYKDGEVIYALYYQPPMGTDIRGEERSTNQILSDCNRAHQLLDDKKYEEAKYAFVESMSDSICLEKALFYYSLILIREGEFKESKSQLERILLNEESGYEEKAMKLLNEIK